MGRVGISLDEVLTLINLVAETPEIKLVGFYSHLACSDESDRSFTLEQINQFDYLVKYIKNIDDKIICHLANSGGICYYPNSYFDMVRPGILSYGYFPMEKGNDYALSEIKPCYTLKLVMEMVCLEFFPI